MKTNSPNDIRAFERRELLQTLRTLGPDAPTLCFPWSAADIAAHIVISEKGRGLPMVLGNLVRQALPATITRRAIAAMQPANERMIARARRREQAWPTLLGRLEAGPPAAFHYGSLKHVRLIEEWIHHEDIRRA